MSKRYPWIIPASFLLLPVAVYLAFVIAPTLNSLFYSFTDWAGYGADFEIIGTRNFEKIFSDRLFSNAIKNTAIWLTLAMIVPTLSGLTLALALQGEHRINTIYKSMFYLPICLSPIIVGIIWTWVYNPKLGIVNLALEAIGLGHLTKAWLASPDTALIAVFIAWAWQQTGLNMVIFLAGLTSVPTPMIEAAQVDGATYWQTLRKVIIPMLRPATVVVLALTAINALKSFEIIWVTTQGGPFNQSDTLAVFMYSESFRKYKMGYGSAIAVILFVMTLVIIILYFRQIAAAEELYE
jgi:ABC-type sugar transport system permease subunit